MPSKDKKLVDKRDNDRPRDSGCRPGGDGGPQMGEPEFREKLKELLKAKPKTASRD